MERSKFKSRKNNLKKSPVNLKIRKVAVIVKKPLTKKTLVTGQK
jgi:hypothetical protein